MDFWLRSATLQIGNNLYDLNNFNFEFKIPFEDSSMIQTGEFKIYNLSQNTRNEIERDAEVILNAGYDGDIGVIFIGKVWECIHEHAGVEWITNLKAMSVLDEWLYKKVYKTYKEGIYASNIIEDLLNIFGIEVLEFELAEDIEYPRGKVCDGRVKDILIEIVETDCKSRFLIKHGGIVINDPEKWNNPGVILTPKTGLLRNEYDTELTVIPTGHDIAKSVQDKAERGMLVTRECLLNHRIGAGDLVEIRSKQLTGTFAVVKGEHTGSPNGSWKTIIEIKLNNNENTS